MEITGRKQLIDGKDMKQSVIFGHVNMPILEFLVVVCYDCISPAPTQLI